MSQTDRIGKLLLRKSGATAMEIIEVGKTTCPQKKGAWSQEEDAVLISKYPHVETVELSKEIGRSRDAIYMRARQLGVGKTQAALQAAKSKAGKKSNAGQFKPVHGMAHRGNATYICWYSMKARCYDSKHKSFARYGGRGISVCDEWRNDFGAFLRDMGVKPTGMTIGRIDNDGIYCKENCEWQSMKQQQNNRVTNRLIEAFGRRQTLSQWAEEVGISSDAISKRIDQLNWPIEKAVSLRIQ